MSEVYVRFKRKASLNASVYSFKILINETAKLYITDNLPSGEGITLDNMSVWNCTRYDNTAWTGGIYKVNRDMLDEEVNKRNIEEIIEDEEIGKKLRNEYIKRLERTNNKGL